MRHLAVIDTSVIVSAFLNRTSSAPSMVLEEALTGRIIPLLHDDILEEYNDVLLRPKFNFDRHEVDIVIAGIIKRGIYVDAAPLTVYLPDPDDAVFYQVVMEARNTNNAYLITGNQEHFPQKSFVVTPREMLEILRADEIQSQQ